VLVLIRIDRVDLDILFCHMMPEYLHYHTLIAFIIIIIIIII